MSDSPGSQAGAAEIVTYLRGEAQNKLGAAVSSKPLQDLAIGSLGLFPYYYEYTLDTTKFNAKTYDWIDSALKAGSNPLEQEGNFTNRYIQAITAISYSLSTDAQEELNAASNRTTAQAGAVQNAWQSNIGAVPAGEGAVIDRIAGEIATKWAVPATTLQDIQNSIDLNQLLNKTPAAGQPVLSVFVNWLNEMSSVLALQNSVSVNNAYLNRAKRAAQSPTVTNGGVTLGDGNIMPAYPVSTDLGTINNAMESGTPSIDMSMLVSYSSENTYQIKIGAQESFTAWDLFFSVSVDASQNYFHSDIAVEGNQTTVEMHFPGVNLVNFGPAEFQMSGESLNWYWMDPIKEAINNGQQDVSGYKWSTGVPPGDFSTEGPFGFISGVAISSFPTITITCKSADYKRIQNTFEQSASTSVSFLGASLSLSEGTYSNKVQVDETNQTVTITIAPPKNTNFVANNEATGWVIGAQTTFPAA